MKPLTIDSPPHEVMAHLRRAILLRQIRIIDADKKEYRELIEGTRESELADTHVYDYGYLLDDTHADFIGQDVGKMLFREADVLQHGIGLLLPHQKSTFLYRCNAQNHAVLTAKWFQELNNGIIAHSICYSCKHREWVWLGAAAFDRYNKSYKLLTGRQETIDDGSALRSLFAEVFISIGLLNSKADTVIREPVDCEWLDQPVASLKAFQKPNPSVGIIKVNTNRILRPQADTMPTGAKMRPHDRRGHPRHVGRKVIWIKPQQINGGAPFPTAKIIEVDKGIA